MYYTEKDFDLVTTIEKADAGDEDAMRKFITYVLANGFDDDEDINGRLVRYYKKLADNNSGVGCIRLGDMYLEGDKVEKNFDKAIEYYKKAVECGVDFGYECVGMAYYKNAKSTNDFKTAYQYFTKVDFDEQSPCTTFTLGEMHRLGQYVEKDLTKALEMYEMIVDAPEERQNAIDSYYPRAVFRIAQAYHYGYGTEPDIERAVSAIEYVKKRAEEENFDGSLIGRITIEQINSEWLKLLKETEE